MDSSFHSPVQVEHQPAPAHILGDLDLGLAQSPPVPTAIPPPVHSSQPTEMPSAPAPSSTITPETSAPDRPVEMNGVVDTSIPGSETSPESQVQVDTEEPQPMDTDSLDNSTGDSITPTPTSSEPSTTIEDMQQTDSAEETVMATPPPPAPQQDTTPADAAPTEDTAPAASSEETQQPPAPEESTEEPPTSSEQHPSDVSPEQSPQSSPEPPPPPPPAEEPPEEEPAYWADIQEDTSVPDEDELEEIEAATGTYSALDYDFCEKACFKPLDDPEYQPTEKARVTWKIKGVRGTKEKPNRALIMRSPAAYVGGYYWTIKFFPRGNSVSSLSIYVECSTTPPTPDDQIPDTEFKVVKGPANANLSNLTPEVDMKLPATANSSKSGQSAAPAEVNGEKTESGEAAGNSTDDASSGSSTGTTAPPTDPTSTFPSTSQTWRVSAEVGVILYNPNEPRTGWLQSASHQFSPHNLDWGWTHFHGPWDQIHRRQRGQRQALLRDDTLAFDAYIRIIDDPTKSLWWHSSDGEPVWDSLSLTGFRPMGDETSNYSHEVAGLVSWLMMAPVREIIQRVDILEHLRAPNVRPRPLCNALQKFLWSLRTQPPSSQLYVSTEGVTLMLKNFRETSRDVIGFWELLRRSLELELEETDSLEKLSKIFDAQPLTLPFKANNYHCLPSEYNSRIRIVAGKAKSVQLGMSNYLSANSDNNKWSLPSVLHVELARQYFDKSNRQWKMIYDRVRMDEELDLSPFVPDSQPGNYTLYGFIVHKGPRTSGQFYSILRPGGPGSHWLAFEDASENRVVCMTRKAAVEGHEGVDPKKDANDKVCPDVAVVVMYIRSDLVSTYLPGKLEEWMLPKLREHYFQTSDASLQLALEETGRSTIRVELFGLPEEPKLSNSVFDAYDLMALSRQANNSFWTLDVPIDTTLSGLRRKFAELVSAEGGVKVDPESIRFWKIGARQAHSPPALHLETLHDLSQHISLFELDVLRLWVHRFSEDDVKIFAQLDPAPPKQVVPDNPPQQQEQEQPDAPTLPPVEQLSSQPPPPENNDVVMSDDNSAADVDSRPPDEPIPNVDVVVETVSEGTQGSGNDNAPTETPPQEDTPMEDAPLEETPPVDGLSSADAAAIAVIIASEIDEFDRGETMDAQPTPPAENIVHNDDGDGAVGVTETAQQSAETEVESQVPPPPPVVSVDTATNASVSDASQTEAIPVPQVQPQSQSQPQGEEDVIMQDSNPDPTEQSPEIRESQSPPQDNEDNDFDGSDSEMDEGEAVAELSRRSNLVSTTTQVYYFVQIFDEEKQKLELVGGFVAKKSDVIKQAVRTALKWPEDRNFLLWQRVDGASIIAISSSQIFEDVVPYTHEGDCFVVGNNLTSSEKLKLSEAGKFPTPHGLVLYDWDFARRHPIGAFSGHQTTEASYGGHYYTGEFKNGQWHGSGTHISDTGATYTGNFVLGQRQGKGTMEHASGDIYEGDWFQDQRHGQGTFIERKTGNKYVGGYRDGKRHGKGISYWEVADEEMELCQICYTEDQDALFYPCGHVCACVDCAKQVETCPMCRKKAVSVVRIYRS